MIDLDAAQQATTQQRARIQLISFVAILFLLVVTFAMFALALEKKSTLPLDIPSCWGDYWGKPDLVVVLQVTDAGLYWNKELITQRELPDRLAKYVANQQACFRTPHILLAGDDHAKYGTTIETLDEIRKAGIEQVTVESVYRATGQ